MRIFVILAMLALTGCATPEPTSVLVRESDPTRALALGWAAFDQGVEGYTGPVDTAGGAIRLEARPVAGFSGRIFDFTATGVRDLRVRGAVFAQGATLLREEALFVPASPSTLPIAVVRTTIDPQNDRGSVQVAFPGVRPDALAAEFATLQTFKQYLEDIYVPGVYAPRTVRPGDLLRSRDELRRSFASVLPGVAQVTAELDERVVGLTTFDGRRGAVTTLTGTVRLVLNEGATATLRSRGYAVIDLDTGVALREYFGMQLDVLGTTNRTLHEAIRTIAR